MILRRDHKGTNQGPYLFQQGEGCEVWAWGSMMDREEVGRLVGSKYDQNTLYKILKELIKIFSRKLTSTS